MIRTIASKPNTLLRSILSPFALLRFPLPDLGEKIKEGRVKKLYVKEGDSIEQFGKLADVESDKQFTEITSPEPGVIKKLYYREDETCQVGDIFLEMETSAPATHQQPSKPAKIEKHSQPDPIPPPSPHHEDILASSTVKMWARQHKVNLSEVKGTGRKGRILKEDIIHFVERREKEKGVEVKTEKKQQISSKVEGNHQITKVKMGSEDQELQKIVNYSNTIPHLYYQETFDVTEIQQIISKIKDKSPKVSLLSILIKTFSLAIKQFPRMNSTYNIKDPFNFKVHPHHNILLPLYLNNGMAFNSIRNAESLSIREIEAALNSQKDGLNLHNISTSTICLSHIGSLGTQSMNPVIYGEVSCHASIGSLRELPFYESGRLIKRQVVDITMGCDHRVLDGATVARFTSAWRDYSESPTLAFLSMV